MDAATNCVKHGFLLEVYCRGCHVFMCPECISEHGKSGHPADYVHVLEYSKESTLKQIENLVEDAKVKDKKIEEESVAMLSLLGGLVKGAEEAAEVYAKQAKHLKAVAVQLKTFSNSKKKGAATSNIVTELENEKKKLTAAVDSKNVKEVVRLTTKIEGESKLVVNPEPVEGMVAKLKAAYDALLKDDVFGSVQGAAGAVTAKCNQLKLIQYQNSWKVDRQYFSTKMFLSEDNLTFGNSASSGYPAIIGDTPFDYGLFAYEAIPTSLDCTGREGFGIIEKDRYLSIWNNDKTTPDVRNDIIGYLYRNEAKNMTAVRMADMIMGRKYYVKVNMFDLTVKITGPGVLLTADLKPGVVYVPCFSCGCSSNRIKIRPLDFFDEGEETTT